MAQGTATASRASLADARRRGLLRFALVGVLCLIGIGYISPAYNFYTRSNQIRGAREVNSSLQTTFDTLKEEKERLAGGSYIEEVARRDLGLVKPGEQPFIVKDIEQQVEKEPAAVDAGEAAVPPPEPRNLSVLFPF